MTALPSCGASGGLVFAHELGHNMGLQHDRYAEPGTNWPFPYSFGYVNQRAFDEDAPRDARWRTIMANDSQCLREAGFSCPRLPRFSNPNQRYPDADGDPLGVPGDEPSDAVDGPADAVRTLDETRHGIANFRRSATRCHYRLSQTERTVGTGGGRYSVRVETAPGCAIATRSHDPFLWVASTATETGGGGEIRYYVTDNEGMPRAGPISIGGETLEVRQHGVRDIVNVCDRSPVIRDAIVASTTADDCAEVTAFDLLEIVALDLSERGLTGNLEEQDFADLPNLRTLSLRHNRIGGRIPSSIGSSQNLRVLDLSANEFVGRIPSELGDLNNLVDLRLNYNNLSGPIPPELGRLGNLRYLFLEVNDLTGPIPPELGHLENVGRLDLSGNELTGLIPAELGSMRSLAHLDLTDNHLTGPIPTELGGIRYLSSLLLVANELTGTIPPTLGELSYLRRLGLSWNGLTGYIPPGDCQYPVG